MLPKVACLCPTYGRPSLLANALACFLTQDYPSQYKRLFILDDAGQFDSVSGDKSPDFYLESVKTRFASLPAKYDYLIRAARHFDPDIWLVWDDDDVYLPWYIRSHVAAQLEPIIVTDPFVPQTFSNFSQPDPVMTDYPGRLILEGSAGRFHGSLGIGKHLLRQLGNNWIPTRRADFDQQMISACGERAVRLLTSPKEKPGYIFRWGSTQANHCQALMSSPSNEDWYDRYKITEPGFVGQLHPKFDLVTIRYLSELAQDYRALWDGPKQIKTQMP